MGIEMVSYPAFFDELEKIAEEEQKDDNWVTKQRLKRLAVAVPVAGLGLLGGHFAGKGLAHALAKRQGAIGDFARKHPFAIKSAPMVAAGLAGAAGLAVAARSKKIHDYVKHGDEASRPK